MDDPQFRLCEAKHRCSHTGNLRAHLTACPPTKPTNACDVWNYLTDDETEEEEEIVSSPLSAAQTIPDDENKDDEERR
ncbi:hypothetical protein VC83_05661 [Pseudogymnoascus destructans]|uniref:Uncharacterized protein n=1 Tax=Pseudogymnoascus destructans TaxID=655981 RepID=A0A177A6M4_9PEZI|nr:uncharacterized protein VC83_05661 [Pseudogymnoascus destructans]OAF57816.1 hypothetical protein VC83_05661 [Pseudogymnoascus destructans]